MVVCVSVCKKWCWDWRKGIGKKGTKMRVKDDVLTLREYFLAFFKSNQDFSRFKDQAVSAPRNSARLMNAKPHENLKHTTAHSLQWDKRGKYWSMKGAAVTHCLSPRQAVRVLRDLVLLPMQGPDNACCSSLRPDCNLPAYLKILTEASGELASTRCGVSQIKGLFFLFLKTPAWSDNF